MIELRSASAGLRKNGMMSVLCVGFAWACARQQPAPQGAEAQLKEDTSAVNAPSQVASQSAAVTAEPSALRLAEAAAAQVASRWKTEEAIAQEAVLSVRFRVDGMSALVLGNELGGRVITGEDAEGGMVDVVVDLDKDAAAALAKGETDLHRMKTAGALHADNEQGLERFLSFIDDDN